MKEKQKQDEGEKSFNKNFCPWELAPVDTYFVDSHDIKVTKHHK